MKDYFDSIGLQSANIFVMNQCVQKFQSQHFQYVQVHLLCMLGIPNVRDNRTLVITS